MELNHHNKIHKMNNLSLKHLIDISNSRGIHTPEKDRKILIENLKHWYDDLFFGKFSRGYIVLNKGPRKTMEDSYILANYNDIIIYGVFDGHGGDAIAKNLPNLFETILLKRLHQVKNNSKKIVEVITRFFKEIDFNFYEQWKNGEIKQEGSTASLIICIKNDIYFINLGDSRTILFNDDRIIFSTCDHKPKNITEMTRINNSNFGVSYINNISRINGKLAVSRGFGDFKYKLTNNEYDGINSAVSIIPDITVINIDDRSKPRYIVIATDGLWDVFSNKQIRKYILYQKQTGIDTKIMLKNLINLTYHKNSYDNVSIILVYI